MKAKLNKPIPLGYIQLPKGTEVDIVTTLNNVEGLTPFKYMGKIFWCSDEDLDIIAE